MEQNLNQFPDFNNYQPNQGNTKYTFKCVLGLLIIFTGFLSILVFHSTLSGFMRIIAGLLLFPPTLKIYETYAKIKINRVVRYVSIILLVQISLIISFVNISSDIKSKKAQSEDQSDLLNKDSTSYSSIMSKPDSLLSNHELEEKVELKLEEVKIRNKKFQDKYLSSWDGSFRPLVIYVKDSMDDPESFEHVNTSFWNQGDHITIIMQFRGNNKFGAKIISSIKAEVSWEGKILRINNGS